MNGEKVRSSWLRNLICYGASFLAGGGLFYLYIALREFPVEEASENYRMLADAATVPGLLFVLFGALLWAAGKGAVDGVTYAMIYAFRALIPGARFARDMKYSDYVERRKEKRKKGMHFAFLFIVGMVFLAAAGVFIFLFYKAI